MNECNRFDGSIVNRPTDGFRWISMDSFDSFDSFYSFDSIETVLVASRVLSFPLLLSFSPSLVLSRRRVSSPSPSVHRGGGNEPGAGRRTRASMGDIDGRLRASARRAVEVKNTPHTQKNLSVLSER